MIASCVLTAFDNKAEISAKQAGSVNRAHAIRSLSLFSTKRNLSRNAKFSKLRMRISLPLSKVTKIHTHNFEKFCIARMYSPSGKLVLA